MSHPPRLVVGEGGRPQQHALWGFYCTCTHMCSPDLAKETTLVEGDQIIVGPVQISYPPTFYQPGKVRHNIDSCNSTNSDQTRQNKFSLSYKQGELQRGIFLHIVHLKRGEWRGLTPTHLS